MSETSLTPFKDFRIPIRDFMTLIYSFYRGLERKDIVGFEDADKVYTEIIRRYGTRTLMVRSEDVESLLWSANLLNEHGEFWDPKGDDFDKFLKRVLPRWEFDKRYNYIKEI